MNARIRLLTSGFIALVLLAGWNGAVQRLAAQGSLFSYNKPAETAPLVLVVHGIGTDFTDVATGASPRSEGWSGAVAKAYGTSVQEITFRYPDRTAGQSFVDAQYAGVDWARQVQSQIQAAVKANPGRRVVIVSHSWGTVVTKLALGGGSLKNGDIEPIQGVGVDEWVTLGAAIGDHYVTSPYGGGVNFWADAKPAVVKNWTNFYDPLDSVSTESQNLPGANNVEVNSTGFSSWIPGWRALNAHSGIWTNVKVVNHVKARVTELGTQGGTVSGGRTEQDRTASTRPPTATPRPTLASAADAAPGSDNYAPICQSAMTAIERHFAKLYGPEFVRIEWVRPFTYDKGDCVGGYRLWAKRLSDQKEWTPLEWNADTGTGRVSVTGLVQQYAKDNPDLQWTPGAGRPRASAQTGAVDYGRICQSAMTAIERKHAAAYGAEFVRVEWIRPLTHDKGDCVGGYRLWAKRLSDQKEWAPLEWFADTGTGRLPVTGLVREFENSNPDLPWSTGPAR